jgi:hypothetical protein
MDIEGGMDSVNSMELVAKMDYSQDGYYTDETVCENSTGCNFNQYDVMSDNEKSQELLRMVCICMVCFFYAACLCWYDLFSRRG